MLFADARLRSGFEIVADALDLDALVAAADVVIAGEGSLDAQTLLGKGPMGVAKLARARGKRVFGVGGLVDSAAAASDAFDATFSLESFGRSKEESITRARELLRKLGQQLARHL